MVHPIEVTFLLSLNNNISFNKMYFYFKQLESLKITLCRRRLDSFYIVSYYVKWVVTSWTYSMISEGTKPDTSTITWNIAIPFKLRCFLNFRPICSGGGGEFTTH